MGKLWLFIFLLSALSCRSARSDYPYKLSDFFYNGHKHNRHIVNRVPDYALFRRDGCIVEEQASLLLTRLNDSMIYGRVVTPLCNMLENKLVSVKIIYPVHTTILPVDSIGQFWFCSADSISTIKVTSIRCRKLVVDMKGLLK